MKFINSIFFSKNLDKFSRISADLRQQIGSRTATSGTLIEEVGYLPTGWFADYLGPKPGRVAAYTMGQPHMALNRMRTPSEGSPLSPASSWHPFRAVFQPYGWLQDRP
jgi:hypothetical protein